MSRTQWVSVCIGDGDGLFFIPARLCLNFMQGIVSSLKSGTKVSIEPMVYNLEYENECSFEYTVE